MPRVIAIANQKGGVGETTTTWHLAGGLVAAGHRTLAIDLDGQGSLSRMVEDDARPPSNLFIADFLQSFRTLEAAGFLRDSLDQQIRTLPMGADLISGSQNSNMIKEILVAEEDHRLTLRHFLATLDGRYDFILLDAPATNGPMTQMAAVAADTIVIPVEAMMEAFDSAVEFVQLQEALTQKLNLLPPRLVVFCNRFKAGYGEDQETLEALHSRFGDSCVPEPLRQTSSLKHAFLEGHSILVWCPKVKSGYQAQATFREIFDRVLEPLGPDERQLSQIAS